MTDRRAVVTLVLIMVGVSMIAVGVAFRVLYTAAFEEQRSRLIESVSSHAKLVEAIARFDAVHSVEDHPQGARGATLSQVMDALASHQGPDLDVEFVMARLDGDEIQFLVNSPHKGHVAPPTVPINSKLAGPMRRALFGESGTVIDLDYRGERVLAAYAPVKGLEWAIVEKIDLAVVRAPFIRAGLVTLAVVLVVVSAGTLLFVRVSAPLLRRLEQSEARHRTILNNAPDGIITVSDEGRVESFNPAAEQIFGYHAEEVVGRQVSMLNPDARHLQFPPLLARYRQLTQGSGQLRREVTGRTRDGRPLPLELSLSDIMIQARTTFTVIVRDISERRRAQTLLQEAHTRLEERVEERTNELVEANRQLRRQVAQRRRAEQALQLQHARLEALLQLGEMADAPQARIADFALDRVVRLTGSELGFLGFLKEDESVMSMHAWTDGTMHRLPVDGSPEAFEVSAGGLWAEAVRSRQPVIINDYVPLEPETAGTAAGQLPIRRFLSVPVFDDSRIVATAAVANKQEPYERDDVRQVSLLMDGMWRLLQRKREQECLRESEERYRTVTEFSTDCVFWRAPDGSMTYISPACAELTGREPEDFYANPGLFDQLVHPEDRPQWEAHAAGATDGEPPSPVQFRIRRKDGGLVWLDHRCRAVNDDQGTFLGLRGSVSDITERRAADERLRSSLAEKEVLLREIHHRVKNNLQVIVSLLRLQSHSFKDPGIGRILRDSEARVKSMALIHEQLYRSSDLTRIDAGDFIRSLAQNLLTAYGAGAARPTLDVSADDVTLDMDSAIPCGLIINELLSNALKYAFPDGRRGRVSISLRATGSLDRELVVKDDGVGLPETVDPRETKTLGLTLVSTLVDQLGGTFEVSRQAGTEFRIHLSQPEDDADTDVRDT
jgi:PAS domain S-box-containing protein